MPIKGRGYRQIREHVLGVHKKKEEELRMGAVDIYADESPSDEYTLENFPAPKKRRLQGPRPKTRSTINYNSIEPLEVSSSPFKQWELSTSTQWASPTSQPLIQSPLPVNKVVAWSLGKTTELADWYEELCMNEVNFENDFFSSISSSPLQTFSPLPLLTEVTPVIFNGMDEKLKAV